ncbi:MAG: GNAT family N-acetyltransferase [Candidatus Micrarchaeota archaeon]|nr:GNAT family N-acetyltransferase [Candidatus Micrarchaeota archaeon]
MTVLTHKKSVTTSGSNSGFKTAHKDVATDSYSGHGKKYTLKIYSSLSELDQSKVKCLLESSFGKKLVADYFANPAKSVILEENYRGIAIIKEVDGVPYLDKLAVVPELQGNGLAKELMDKLKEEFPQMIWRAKKSNPINTWYFKNSDGHFRIGEWTIFWYGLQPEAAILLVPKITAIPKTLEETDADFVSV